MRAFLSVAKASLTSAWQSAFVGALLRAAGTGLVDGCRDSGVKFRDWARSFYSDDEDEAEESAAERERRLDARHDFIGEKIIMRDRRTNATLQLKDLSSKGACGVSDVPFALGATVFLQLKKPHFHAAEVRWVRNATMGLRFYRPLPPEFVEKLHEAHVAARRAREAAEARGWQPSTKKRAARAR